MTGTSEKIQALVVADPRDGADFPLTLGAFAAALELVESPEAVAVAVLSDAPQKTARALARITGSRILAVAHPGLAPYLGAVWAPVAAGLVRRLEPDWIVAAHTTSGMDLAPALAAILGAAHVPGVSALGPEADGPVFTRPVLSGKRVMRLSPAKLPCVFTVLPGAFSAPASHAGEPGPVEEVPVDLPHLDVKFLGGESPDSGEGGIDTAEVVVAAGRGVCGPENLELVQKTAALFTRSAVAGSRPVVDQGLLPHAAQVGASGKSVSPRLYLACGISGAYQHLAGIAGARFVAAVNTDPSAAVFGRADVGVVARIEDFLPVFIEICENTDKE